jgi:hypothetical protein
MCIKKYSKCIVDYALKYPYRLQEPWKWLSKLFLNLIKVFGYVSEGKLQTANS